MSIFNGQYISLNFFYDKARVAEEILQHKFTDIPAIKQFLSLRPFDLVEQSLYDKVTVLTEYGIIQGSVPSWKGYSFTHVLGDMMSNYGSNLSRIKYENWTWKLVVRGQVFPLMTPLVSNYPIEINLIP